MVSANLIYAGKFAVFVILSNTKCPKCHERQTIIDVPQTNAKTICLMPYKKRLVWYEYYADVIKLKKTLSNKNFLGKVKIWNNR